MGQFTNEELKLIHESISSRIRHLAKRIGAQAELGIRTEGPHGETAKTIESLQVVIEKLEPMIRI